jgi:hypothetical protein
LAQNKHILNETEKLKLLVAMKISKYTDLFLFAAEAVLVLLMIALLIS